MLYSTHQMKQCKHFYLDYYKSYHVSGYTSCAQRDISSKSVSKAGKQNRSATWHHCIQPMSASMFQYFKKMWFRNG